MSEIRSIAKEPYEIYRHHPSLSGFNAALTTADLDRLFAIEGTDENMDVAVDRTGSNVRAAVVNHNAAPRRVTLPGRHTCRSRFGLGSTRKVAGTASISITIPPHQAAIVQCAVR
ncbi:MAG: hypothetical protein AB7F88_09525 [Pyrinomonadaceae bacterium]